MSMYTSIAQLIGGTPLLELLNYSSNHGLKARLLVKLEYLNPTGSVKDRAAISIINDAEQSGRLTKGGTIIEPTSGNTGIGLAAIAAARGYRAIMVMPESMSVERRNILKAYGAHIVLTPASEGMAGSLRKAEELQAEIPGSIIAGQFENPANAQAHLVTTGPEIWNDTDGQVDVLVAGIGTGGTITGTGKFLKSKKDTITVIGVEPLASPLLSAGHAGPHAIQGIGANFVPPVLDMSVVDEILPVDNEAPFATARELAQTEGILVGISSGAALYAATQVAQRSEMAGKTIVVILPDSADRYYSTPLLGS